MTQRSTEPQRPGPDTSPGSSAELDQTIEALGQVEKREVRGVERAILRQGQRAARPLLERFASARPPLRGRLCGVIGRLARLPGADEELARFLLERLDDDDVKTRRNAIIALGKTGDGAIEARLLAAFARETDLGLRRSLSEALGKVGGRQALEALRAPQGDDAELRRIAGEAGAKIARSLEREKPTRVRGDLRPPRPLEALLHCRAGLEQVLLSELPRAWRPRQAGRGRVVVDVDFPLEQLWRARVMLRFGLPLAPLHLDARRSPAEALAEALTHPRTVELLSGLTEGPIRYRLEWVGQGHQRAATWSCALAVAERCPELVNDPRESPWEVQARRSPRGLLVELWPKGLQDPRFAYRRQVTPASSHPTIAAALARLASPSPNAVIWDPFVGTATELIELHRLGHRGLLLGTDLDASALAAAQANLQAAGVSGAELLLGDSLVQRPSRPVDLIVTNPPLGRRVPIADLAGFLKTFLGQAAAWLGPSGRLVWISPEGQRSVEAGRALGLVPEQRIMVDLGGFFAEMQVLGRRADRRG